MTAVEDIELPQRLELSADRVDELTFRKWNAGDLAWLCDDWPDADWLDLGFLVERAIAFARASATPEQVRAWLRVLYVQGSREIDPSPAALVWGATCPDARINRTDPGEDAVWYYSHAAGGDHDLALLAFTAGLGDSDLLAQREAGTLDRAALAARAGQPGSR